jgi:hypothetical protein
MRNERRRNMSERAEPPTMFGIEFDDEAEYSDFVGSALHCFDTAEKSEYTNSEVIVQGLNFLIRASGLGNKNAMSYLHEFVHSLFPEKIPEDGPAYHVVRKRIQIVEKFLNFSREERRIWRCALTNFLAMSRDKKALPRRRFDEAVYNLLYKMDDDAPAGASAPGGESKEKRKKMTSAVIRQLLREALKKSPDSDEVIEEAYCLTVVDFTMGRLNVEFDPEDMTEEQIENFRKAPIMEKLQSYPVKESSMYILKQELPRYIDRNGMRMLRSFVPFKEIVIILTALFAYSMNQFVAVMALCLFLPCFCALVVVTFLLLGRQDKARKNFDVWKRFLSQQQGVVVETRASEVHELTQLADYYIALFTLFMVCLFLFSGAREVIFLSEFLVGTSALMFLLCVFVRKFWKKKILLSALAVKMTIMCVTIAHKAPQKFVSDVFRYMLPEFIRNVSVVQKLVDFLLVILSLIPNLVFWFTYLLLSIAHVFILVLILRGLIGSGKMHFYAISGPFLAASVWWVLWMVFFDFVMLQDSVNWIWLGLSHVPILIPLSVVSSVIGFTFQYFKYLIILAVVVVVIAICVGGCYHYGNKIARIPQLRYFKFDHLLLFFVTIPPLVLLFIFADVFVVTHRPAPPPPVKWGDYLKHCGPDAWVDGNMAVTQINCSSLIGRRSVELSGIIDTVKVFQRDNTYETVFNKFSEVGSLKEAGYCFFGQKSDLCSRDVGDTPTSDDTPTDSGTDTICRQNSRPCNLHHQSRFAFVIKVASVGDESTSKVGDQQGSAIVVNLLTRGGHKPSSADNTLINDIIRNLKRKQMVRFNATFMDGLGSDQVYMKLESIAISGTDWAYDSKEWKKMAEQEKYSQLMSFLINCARSSFSHIQIFVFGKVYL